MVSSFIATHKKTFAAVSLCVAALTVVLVGSSLYAYIAGAAPTSYELAGYGWSSDTGWISFSSINCDLNDDGRVDSTAAGCPAVGTPVAKYRVSEDPATGALSGYAWSPNVGWITFDSSKTAGCPSGTCAAKVNLSTGALSGWALTCGSFANKNACTGAAEPEAGGWDGWIHLSGTTGSGVSYGAVQGSDCKFSGYAWGSDLNLGWIHFGGPGTGYGVFVANNSSPSCLSVDIADLTSCPVGTVGTYPNCSCPAGTIGQYPLCDQNTSSTCPSGYTGTPPNCTLSNCGPGFTGVPPTCSPTTIGCPIGTTGTPPNCVAGPSVDLSSSKQHVTQGDTVTFTWTVDNMAANSCSITNGSGWTQSINNSASGAGTITTPPITKQTRFTLTCTGNDGRTYTKITSITLNMTVIEK